MGSFRVHPGSVRPIYTASTLYLADTTQSYYRENDGSAIGRLGDPRAIRWGTGPAPSRYAIPALVFLALTFRMVRTSEVAVAYVKRTAFIEERIATARANGIQRGLVLEGPVLQPSGHGVAPLPYMSPMEALLLSARQGPDSIVVLIHPRKPTPRTLSHSASIHPWRNSAWNSEPGWAVFQDAHDELRSTSIVDDYSCSCRTQKAHSDHSVAEGLALVVQENIFRFALVTQDVIRFSEGVMDENDQDTSSVRYHTPGKSRATFDMRCV